MQARSTENENIPRFDPALSLRVGHAPIRQMLAHRACKDMVGVFEVEQGSHVEVSREEVGVYELPCRMHALYCQYHPLYRQ